jgi:hypothetical protein
VATLPAAVLAALAALFPDDSTAPPASLIIAVLLY